MHLMRPLICSSTRMYFVLKWETESSNSTSTYIHFGLSSLQSVILKTDSYVRDSNPGIFWACQFFCASRGRADLISSQGSLYVIASAVYNLAFHPLSKYPGPKIRAAFQWPLLWDMYCGNDVRNTKRFHDKYGHVVRIAPSHLSYSNSQAWEGQYCTVQVIRIPWRAAKLR